MSQEARISSRIEPQLKAQGDAVLAELGLKPSQAVSMFYTQLVRHRRLPFDASLEDAAPKLDVRKYAGIAKGAYGDAAEIEAYLSDMRAEWDS